MELYRTYGLGDMENDQKKIWEKESHVPEALEDTSATWRS